MDTIFRNFENSKTFEPRKLLFNLSDKTNSEKSDKYVTLINFSIYSTFKNMKRSYENNKSAIINNNISSNMD